MNGLSKQELEKTAQSYQELMVPALFMQWAERLLAEAKIKPGDNILDIACGTGVLARVAAEQLGDNGFVAGLDMNPGMLSVAQKLAPDIEWRRGKAEELPWEDQFFDVVACQFGLMFFEDRKKALGEMIRVLKPGGHIVIAVFDSLDNIPGYKIMAGIFGDIAGDEVAQALRFPFSQGDTGELRKLCTDSGLASAEITTRKGSASFRGVKEMVKADVKGWFPLAGFVLNKDQIEEVVRRAETALRDFISENGEVNFSMPAHFITYRKNRKAHNGRP